MTLTLDRTVYNSSDSATLTARLSIHKTPDDPVSLTFPTGQMYDLEIKNERGDVVYRWSRGKVFPQMVLQVPIESEYIIPAPLAGLAPGNYVVQAWLAVEGPSRAYSASATFQIN